MERNQRPQRPQGQNKANQPMQNQQMRNQQMQNQPMQNQQMDAQAYMAMQKQKQKKVGKVIGIAAGVVAGIAVLGVLLYFIGTGRVSSRVVELEAEVANLEQRILDNNASHAQEVKRLEEAIADTTVKEVVPTTSLQRIEATEVPELWLIDGDFIAPNPIELPNATESVNDSYMQIGQKFIFRPSDRWVVTSRGATYEFGHPQQIWGKIRAFGIRDLIPNDDMKDLVMNFFVGYPATEITYNKIFIDDRLVGMRGKAEVTVKYREDGTIITDETDGGSYSEKNIVINVGFLQRSEYALSFIFVYDAEGGSNSQELIDLLLRSGSYGTSGGSIKLE